MISRFCHFQPFKTPRMVS